MRAPIALLLFAAACGASEISRTRAGHLEVSWSGSSSGELSAEATAEWCEPERLLEIRAVRGDTGVALAILPEVILAPDTYLVVSPRSGDSVVPSSRVALRWFGATSISGFQGDSGAVVLESADSGDLSGSVVARAWSVSTSERLTVTGTFRDLPVLQATRGCAPDTTRQGPADPGSEPGAGMDDVD